MAAEPFIFGIPLIAATSAEDWERVEALLALTLRSLGAQTDREFRIILAGHDRPRGLQAVEFLQADWPAEPVRPDNRDSGRKKHAISREVLATGGGLLMFLDADDWVDVRLVETARAAIGADDIGGLIDQGFAVNLRALRACPLPHPGVFDGGFHKVCGSSTIARLRPEDPDPLRRDPTVVLHEHYRWTEAAGEHQVSLARLEVTGHYVVDTAANHSERHGPFAAWRRTFNAAVATHGSPVDETYLARVGLDVAAVEACAAGQCKAGRGRRCRYG